MFRLLKLLYLLKSYDDTQFPDTLMPQKMSVDSKQGVIVNWWQLVWCFWTRVQPTNAMKNHARKGNSEAEESDSSDKAAEMLSLGGLTMLVFDTRLITVMQRLDRYIITEWQGDESFESSSIWSLSAPWKVFQQIFKLVLKHTHDFENVCADFQTLTFKI